jgi:mycobactin peptide synthetase MbtE
MEPVLSSVGEQALWALRQADPLASAYNVGIAVRVPDGLDPARLRAAVAALAGRHAPLRTTIEEGDGLPYRVMREDAQPSVEIEQATELDEAALHRRAEY